MVNNKLIILRLEGKGLVIPINDFLMVLKKKNLHRDFFSKTCLNKKYKLCVQNMNISDFNNFDKVRVLELK